MTSRIFIAAALCVACALTECNGASPDACDANCTQNDGGNQVPPVSGGGCDSSKPASQGGCAVDDTDGFFVSPMGSDANVGSKAAPFLTVQAGSTAAAANTMKANVYVCAGTYAENVVIQNAPAGVAMHGGFDCATWTLTTSATTSIAPVYATSAKPQYPLHVIAAAALIENITLTAPDAKDPGISSIAAFVENSPGMTFRRATVIAGKGTDGQSPAAAPGALSANTSGNNGTIPTGGAEVDCKCGSDTTVGGQGGTYNVDGGAPGPGLPYVNGDMDGGRPGNGSSGCSGTNGNSGLAATSGASATTLGLLASAGWTAQAGATGNVGGTAQGGGGAEFNFGNPLIAGGSGGCGGCGGVGAAGGGGGGASIALAALGTTLRIQSSTLRAGNGGNGANGVAGQLGQPGGMGGVNTNNSCFAGNGGTGGMGGASGGGAGGVSIAIATSTTTPDIDSQSTVLAGTAGVGGHDGSALAVKAIDGIAAAAHDFGTN